MTSKTCQVNFDEVNIKNSYRSGCQTLQDKKMTEEINFLREKISEKKFVIRSLFSLKLSNRQEDNWFHKVRKNTNGKDISESCINDEIPECKCVNGPIEDDIALHKKINYDKNRDECSNNLSTINNYKTSENNTIRTTETPDNSDVINDSLAAPTRKEKFRTNTASFKLGSTETELNKRKNSSPIICELDTPVTTKTVSSKPSSVDFDAVIDKPSKQESPRSSKIKNCPVIEVKQTVKHSDEQVNTRKEIQTAQTENINNADNNTVQENNEEWRKGTTLILGDSTISGLIEKKMSRNRKIKVRYFPGAKIKDMYHYVIPLLEKKPENIILHLGKKDTPYKSDTAMENTLRKTMKILQID